MKNFKKHTWFITAFSFTILIFLYPLISMRSSFLYGDSFVQFFPWLKCYSYAIKHFSFPYWIKSMGSGFPLMAEGQVGGFYPLNIILFFILPFKVAYNYSIILHFILGGIFTYFYTRGLGADEKGGYIAALLFCFGSAYGGCFYNIVTLRTLTWFPFVLLLLDRFIDRQNLKYAFFAGCVLGLQLLAGFVQMAVYSAFFYLVYFIYRSILCKAGLRKTLSGTAVFLTVSFIISIPQIALSYQLSALSGRESAALGFALWGSFLPSGLLGAIFPYSFSYKSNFYIGVLSLLFVISSFYFLKKQLSLRPVVLLFVLSVFLALGAYNPLYVIMLKLTRFYIFRNPSKFLFFGIFCLSVLAGYGFTRFFDNMENKKKLRAERIFSFTLIAAGFIFICAKSLLFLFKKSIIALGDYYVRYFIYNKPHHRYGLEYYLSNVRSFYDGLVGKFSFSNIFTVFSWGILVAALLAVFIISKKKLKNVVILLIFTDIFIFSFYGIGFRGNIRPFTELNPDCPGILEKLKSDAEPYRILPFDMKSQGLPNWSMPNANIIYDIDSIACYTPLAGRSYKDLLADLEVVDDSLGVRSPPEGVIGKDAEILRLLNVKYVVSHKILREDFLKLVDTENEIFLYKIDGYLPRVFFSYDMEGAINMAPSEDFKLMAYNNGFIELEITNDKNGFIVLSENYYPGWHAYVDGREKPIFKVRGFLQGVAIDNGKHKVNFVYKPYSTPLKNEN